MERGHVIVVAVVVAVLGLFGLKVWSDRMAASTLDTESRGASERLARASGLRGPSDSWNQPEVGSDGGYSRPGGSPLRAGGGGAGAAGHAVGPDGRGGGGSAGSLRTGGSLAGGSLAGGASGSGRVPGGWGGGSGEAANVVGGEGLHGAPKAAPKQNLADFLSSPTQPNLAGGVNAKAAEGDDVALKIDKLEDINSQGGQQQNVQAADDGDGIRVTDGSEISFPNNVNPDAATISLKVQPDWSGSDHTDNALLELRGQNDWANRLELVKNGDYLRFIVTPDSGQESNIGVDISNWQAGAEHDIRASYGDGKMYLYIDGQLAGTTPYSGSLQFSNNPVRIGSDWPGSNYAPFMGTIRNVSITGPTSPNG